MTKRKDPKQQSIGFEDLANVGKKELPKVREDSGKRAPAIFQFNAINAEDVNEYGALIDDSGIPTMRYGGVLYRVLNEPVYAYFIETGVVAYVAGVYVERVTNDEEEDSFVFQYIATNITNSHSHIEGGIMQPIKEYSPPRFMVHEIIDVTRTQGADEDFLQKCVNGVASQLAARPFNLA